MAHSDTLLWFLFGLCWPSVWKYYSGTDALAGCAGTYLARYGICVPKRRDLASSEHLLVFPYMTA